MYGRGPRPEGVIAFRKSSLAWADAIYDHIPNTSLILLVRFAIYCLLRSDDSE
jgi:hypothetical protein